MKTEIYSVHFNKYKTPSGDIGFNQYTLGMGYNVADMTITPVKIILIKDRVHVLFSDGGKHTFGYNDDTELFYRPIVEKTGETKTDTTQ
jgi:hypothetical protein